MAILAPNLTVFSVFASFRGKTFALRDIPERRAYHPGRRGVLQALTHGFSCFGKYPRKGSHNNPLLVVVEKVAAAMATDWLPVVGADWST